MQRKRRHPIDDSGLVYALLYVRVSGAEHQKEGLSLAAQEKTTRTYAARPSWLIAGEYRDIMTGRRADRPQYQALLEHARQLSREGKRVAVVVIRLNRLGRNKPEYFRAEAELAQLGVELHSIKDGGVLDPTHAGVLAVFAAKEAQQIGENVAATRSQLVNDGYHYGRVPFGYRKRPATAEEIASGRARRMATPNMLPHVFEPDPATRHIALECFERIAAGVSIRAVSRWMASLPEEERGGRLWPTACVAVLLRSPTYVGRPSEGDDDVLARPRARWEPIVSDELWAAVTTQLDKHVDRPQRPTGRYLLTGFLCCPVCGQGMVAANRRRTRASGELRADYRCSGWARGANAPVANCMYSLPLATIDELVVDQVATLLGALVEVDDAVLAQGIAASAPPVTDWGKQIAACQRKITRSQELLAGALRLVVDGTADMVSYGALRDREVAEIDRNEAELSRLRAKQREPIRQPRAVDTVRALRTLLPTIGEDFSLAPVGIQRRILGLVVERVVARRTGYRTYAAAPTWTLLGQQLADLLDLDAANDAA